MEDNGRGIAEENQRKIFRKSARMHKNIKGSGMGLYIIKKMLENNQARIKLESKLGEGTRFSAYFGNE